MAYVLFLKRSKTRNPRNFNKNDCQHYNPFSKNHGSITDQDWLTLYVE